jgi:signal transduction histidine kinase
MKVQSIITLFLILVVCAVSVWAPLRLLATQSFGIKLDNPKQWTFHPNQENVVIKGFLPSESLGFYLQDISCCKGTYKGAFTIPEDVLAEASKSPADALALFIPGVGGLTAISLNGRVSSFRYRDFGSVGVIVPLPQMPSSGLLEIEIAIDAPKTEYAGIWNGAPLIGGMSRLIEKRDALLAHQKTVPIFHSLIFGFLAVIFAWVHFSRKRRTFIYAEFAVCLFTWSIFYLYLAGVVRTAFPFWGGTSHLAVRVLCSLALFRVIASFAGIEKRTVFKVSVCTTFFVLIQLITASVGNLKVQSVIYAMSPALIVYATMRLHKQRITWIDNALFSLCIVAIIGFVNDALKNLGHVFHYDYPFIYLNRYSTPPVLLLSVIYLASQLLKESETAVRSEIIEEITAMVRHDIQAPLLALSVAAKSTGVERDTIIQHAIERIRKISQSLESKTRGVPKSESYHLKTSIEAVVREKQIQDAKLTLTVTFHSDAAEAHVMIERSNFERAFSNLLDNSIEALRGNGRISVEVFRSNKNVRIEIHDNGIGISPEQIASVGQKGITSKGYGHGLGAYQAIQAIEASGGTLIYRSVKGEGTETIIQLPLC